MSDAFTSKVCQLNRIVTQIEVPSRAGNRKQLKGKGKGIRFIVLYPPKCSHDLQPLAGLYTLKPFHSIFQSNWQHNNTQALSTALFMLHVGTHFAAW